MELMVKEVLTNAVLALFGILLYGALGYFKAAIKEATARTELIKNDAKQKLVHNTLAKIDKLAELSVTAIESVTAKELRGLIALGKADKEELCDLSQKALSEIKRMIGPESMKLLTEEVKDVDSYVKNVIETQLLILKQEIY